MRKIYQAPTRGRGENRPVRAWRAPLLCRVPRFPGTLSPGLPIQALCRAPLSVAPATLPPSYRNLRCAANVAGLLARRPPGVRRDRAACRPLRRDSKQRRPKSVYPIPAPPQRGQSKSRPPPRPPAMAARISRPPAPPASRLERAISCPDSEAWRHVTPHIHRDYLIPLASQGLRRPPTRGRANIRRFRVAMYPRPGCPPRGARCIPSSPTESHTARAARGSTQER